MRILVIEDESDLATAIRDALDAASFAVDLAVDGEDGLHWALGVDYDAIVLDLMLPRLDGWSVLERVREIKQTP
ncbi:MAG: response regulator, partial [Planctomycetota bacterium]